MCEPRPDELLGRASRTRIDAYYWQTFGFPLRDTSREMRGRLAQRHALAGGCKGASTSRTREHDLARPIGRQL